MSSLSNLSTLVEREGIKIMAAEEEKSSDFYGVLGLKKECTASELRDAYKKLALVRAYVIPFLFCFSFFFSLYTSVDKILCTHQETSEQLN